MKTTFPKRIFLEVTASHIARGTKDDCTCCPIALAFSEKFDGKFDPNSLAVRDQITFDTSVNGSHYRYGMPKHFLEFIKKFDCDNDDGTPELNFKAFSGYITKVSY